MNKEKAINIIKVKMRQNPASSASETYKLKMSTFKNSQPEGFLMLLKNFRTVINRTGTTSVTGITNYLQKCYVDNPCKNLTIWRVRKIAQ